MPPTIAPSRKAKQSKLTALLRFDAVLQTEIPSGFSLIGLDEVGRGSLIASVVGGAVRLPPSLTREQRKLLTWLDDSKKLTAATRAELSEAIHGFCAVGIGEASKDEIDRLNIHYASLLALHRAYQQLSEGFSNHSTSGPAPDAFLIMDGRAVIPDLPRTFQKAIIKGDGQSAAIAAASVVAKHYRDSGIKDLALQFPGYGWEVNMGYATPAHIKGIQALGLTPLHRKNFTKAYRQLTLPLENVR
jgi:ribonuclease HII